MYLHRLEIFGFKSFADKITLDLGDGITSIVGPNGCGKTNVVDAIRWALGEQRPSLLRSDRMEDVIFCGSKTRKPLGMSEVTLTIQNTKNILPIEFSEVQITRRIFGSGQSDYLLNKVPCRLMDVNNLFMDTGMGPHAYTVMEQNMVEAIIGNSTEDRRRLFEEVAGITKYKVRRKATWNKLTSTQQDVLRIGDIIAEVENQVAYLRRQVGKARRYQAYQEKLKESEISLGRHNYYHLETRIRPLADQIEKLRVEIEEDASGLSLMESQIERIRLNLIEKDKERSRTAQVLNSQMELIQRKSEEVIKAQARMESLTKDIERLGLEVAEATRKLDQTRRESEKAEESKTRVKADYLSIKDSLNVQEEELARLDRSYSEKRSELEVHKEKLIQLFRSESQNRGAIERDKAHKDNILSRLEKLLEEECGAQSELKDALKREQDALEANRETHEAIQKISREKVTLEGELEGERKRLDSIREQLSDVKGKIEAKRAALALLEKIRESYEGYSESVRTLILSSPYKDQIRGTLADLLHTQEKYAKAIEAALGQSLEYLVTDKMETATGSISFLKEQEGGRATFLPMDRVIHDRFDREFKDDKEQNESSQKPLTRRGSEEKVDPRLNRGRLRKAVDLVRFDDELAPIVRLLLGKTVVVEDLKTALSCSLENGNSTRFVTIEGDIVEPSGQITGGNPTEVDMSLIGRTEQIEVIQAQIEEEGINLNRLSEQMAGSEARISAISASLSNALDSLLELRDKLSEFKQQEAQSRSDIKRLQARLESISKETLELKERSEQLLEDIENQALEIKRLEGQKEELSQSSGEYERALRTLEENRNQKAEGVHELRRKMTSLEERLRGFSSDVKRCNIQTDELEKTLSDSKAQSEKAGEELDRLKAQKDRDQDELEHLYSQRSQIEKDRDTKDSEYHELEVKERELENEIRAKRRVQDERRENLSDLQFEHSQLTSRAGIVRQNLRDRYGVDVVEVEPLEEEFNPELAQMQIEETQGRIRSLGPVNIGAIEEYERGTERYEFLSGQRDDLLEAEDDLKKTIAKIDSTARSMFIETFSKVAANFRKTFVEFFEGGQADLILSEGDDPLESEINIVARPQGKRLQSINLMSGGEKTLTAIALIFSIYLVKPSPLCILDEVDAPLDDANIERFIRVIRKFSDRTQFVIVTHNKRTMEASDCLHGVTMGEPGVSQLVSVRLDLNRDGVNAA